VLKYKLVYETNSVVQYEYYPEGDTKNEGLVAVSKKSGAVSIVELSPKDDLKVYALKLMKKLRAFHKASEYKKDGIIAWY
jgi:hypothetical protein